MCQRSLLCVLGSGPCEVMPQGKEDGELRENVLQPSAVPHWCFGAGQACPAQPPDLRVLFNSTLISCRFYSQPNYFSPSVIGDAASCSERDVGTALCNPALNNMVTPDVPARNVCRTETKNCQLNWDLFH